MKAKNKNILHVLLISAFSLALQANAYAEEGAIRFTNKAFKQVVITNPDGTTGYDYVEPGLVLPKDIILYEVVSENISDKSVDDIVINNPIANNSSYRANSATGDFAEITFSVDGKVFAAADVLTVKDKTGKTWQAQPEDYSVIRWKYTNSLKPGEKSKATYKTSIK